MSVIDNIMDLMLREGEIKAQQAREHAAAAEEQRQAKSRKLKMTLKMIAQIAPYFIPGVGPIVGTAIGTGLNAASSYRGAGNPSDILLDSKRY